jgi:hypothetical protein
MELDKNYNGILHCSFSGGRTSAYMTKLLKDYFTNAKFIVTFANTGIEHPKTLEFVKKCDDFFGFNTIWLETDVFLGVRKSCGFKIVDYYSASRHGEPFEKVIQKYGIPNVSFPYCTRELKLNPINSYLKSLGIDHKSVPTAIGIREDERRRVSSTAGKLNLIYPLVYLFPTVKHEILDFWKQQPFDLGIEEFEGNCRGCFKKSTAKHFMQLDKDNSAFDWHSEMESKYAFTGPQKGSRVFFRGNTSSLQLQMLWKSASSNKLNIPTIFEDNGCSESCELFPMESY